MNDIKEQKKYLKNQMIYEYVVNKKSQKQIAKELNLTHQDVSRRLSKVKLDLLAQEYAKTGILWESGRKMNFENGYQIDKSKHAGKNLSLVLNKINEHSILLEKGSMPQDYEVVIEIKDKLMQMKANLSEINEIKRYLEAFEKAIDLQEKILQRAKKTLELEEQNDNQPRLLFKI